MRRHRRHGKARLALALRGAPEVRHQQGARAGLRGLLDRRQRRADARIRGDRAVLEGNVQILANQHAPIL